MALIVQKFGGTSVGDAGKIKLVANRVARSKADGNDVLVVVSAMAGDTNRLIELTKQVAEHPVRREYDVVVSAGEQVSAGLLSIALNDMGYAARSLLGFQVPIITDSSHAKARISQIKKKRICEYLNKDFIIIVAGFQGVDLEGSITTLGRGGSDITAVALAAAVNADICEIYTDVDGVYTTDPKMCSSARKLKKISYDEMLEMASLGARILHSRSVEFAKKFNVPLVVRSSFSDKEGTMVTMEDKDMEKVLVSGITYNKDEAKISVVRVPDRPGIAARVFAPLTEANINVDMIVQNISHEGNTDITFTVSKRDYMQALELVRKVSNTIGAEDVIGDANIAKISIVGAGMRSHAGVALKTFETFSSAGINIQMISTSEIKISCVIDVKSTKVAVALLHDAFGLGNDKTVAG